MEPVEAGLSAPEGFLASGVRCGIKADPEALDLGLIYSEVEATVAATFTTNRVHAAPVRLSRQRAARGRARAVVVNSGNANACTGARGLADARKMARLTAQGLGIDESEVLVASTGVIGQYLPMEKVEEGIAQAVRNLARGPQADAAVARAILTTDTHTKAAAARFRVGPATATLAGITKGAGMIAPNMATMLCFLTTDAAVEADPLSRLLREAVEGSFNRISIDGHTSTNDTCICLANGALGNEPIAGGTEAYGDFGAALAYVTTELAKMIVRDGEGVSKFIEVVVNGARTEAEALTVARAVADSPLVKTTLHGEDPNWGRITSAAGYSGAEVEEAKMSLRLGEVLVFSAGEPVEHSRQEAHEQLTGADIRLVLDLGLGSAEAVVWTADLSEEYVRANAQYS